MARVLVLLAIVGCDSLPTADIDGHRFVVRSAFVVEAEFPEDGDLLVLLNARTACVAWLDRSVAAPPFNEVNLEVLVQPISRDERNTAVRAWVYVDGSPQPQYVADPAAENYVDAPASGGALDVDLAIAFIEYDDGFGPPRGVIPFDVRLSVNADYCDPRAEWQGLHGATGEVAGGGGHRAQ